MLRKLLDDDVLGKKHDKVAIRRWFSWIGGGMSMGRESMGLRDEEGPIEN